MKLKPYKEILKMAKEMIDETLAPVRAMRAKKQAELEVAKMDEKIATHEAKFLTMGIDDGVVPRVAPDHVPSEEDHDRPEHPELDEGGDDGFGHQRLGAVEKRFPIAVNWAIRAAVRPRSPSR